MSHAPQCWSRYESAGSGTRILKWVLEKRSPNDCSAIEN
jgi:hypothetical protein